MTDIPPIEKLFPELAGFGPDDFARIGTRRPVLMIAMTARTGSSHLCSALASVLPVGRPTELFNARDTLIWETQRRGVSTFAGLLDSYCAEAPEVIAFKAAWIDFRYFKTAIFQLFPHLKIAYLDRLDVEAQAISLFKAIVTGNWHETSRPKKSGGPSPAAVLGRFDPARICRIMAALEEEKSAWEAYFAEHDLRPARLSYESFTQDLPAAVGQIARHIGHGDIDVQGVRSDYRPLADAVNATWLARLRDHRRKIAAAAEASAS